MPQVALIHSRPEYASALAEAVELVDTEWTVEDLSAYGRGERVCRLLTGRYDVIQADEPLANGVLATVVGTVLRTPTVISLRGWGDITNAHGEYGLLRMAAVRLRTRLSLRAATQTLTLGSKTQRELWDVYRSGVEYAEQVPRPLDIKEFQAGQSTVSDGGDEEAIVLTVTNLRYKGKLEGVKTILDGLRHEFPERPNLRYQIAGGGRFLPELKETVEDHPNADQIEVLGFREDVPSLLEAANVFVYASYLDAYPTAVLEAQAAGLPVVAVDASGVPDAVGDAGIVVADDPGELAGAIGRVFDDDELRVELADKSREKMADYNERAARRYVAVWERCASEVRPTARGG